MNAQMEVGTPIFTTMLHVTLRSLSMRVVAHTLLFVGTAGLALSCQQGSPAGESRISTRDSARVFALFDQAYAMQQTNPDSAYALLQRAGSLSQRYRFDQGLFNYYNQAMYNRAAFRGDFALAHRLGDTALALVNDPVRGQTRDRFRMLTFFSWAVSYQIQERNDSAIAYYLRALDALPLTKDTSRVPMIQNNLAILFHFQQRDDLAVAYQLKSLQSAVNQRDTSQLIAGYVNLYGFEAARRDTVTAATYLRKGLALTPLASMKAEAVELYKNAGDYFLATHQTDSARLFVNRYYTLTKKLFPPAFLAQPLVALARTDLQAGNLPATERNLVLASKLVTPDSLPMLDREAFYQARYQLFKQTNRPAQALVALEKVNKANVDFANGEKNRQLIQYHEQVKQLAHDKLMADRQYLLDRKNNVIIALVVGCVLLATVAVLLVLYWRKRKMLESEKLAKLHLETEWRQLKSRMAAQQEERSRISQELHDELGAALTSVSLASELLKQRPETNSAEVQIIARASSEMTTKMNEIVWSLNVNNDNLQSLVAYIRKFCSEFLGEAGIQMIFTETIANPQRELKGIIRRSVYQSVKEAVHNVVKHAEASRVELAIATVENELHILIQDNGKGMTNGEVAHWSNGLRNMRKNIESVQGQINWITDNGTQVRIQAPMGVG